MPRRCVPSRRFNLESLEHRLTPSTMSLPKGLAVSAEVRAHPFAPSSQALNSSSHLQVWSQQGLGGLSEQVVVVGHSAHSSFVYIDLGFNSNATFFQYSSLAGNLKTKLDGDSKHDKEKDNSGKKGHDSDPDSPVVTPPSSSPGASPGTGQHPPPVVPDDSPTDPTDNSPGSSSGQRSSVGHLAGQSVTTSGDRNALLFTASGARNAVLAQDQLDTANLPLTVNSAQLPLPQQQLIATGSAAAPPRVQLTLPVNSGSNATSQPAVPEQATEEPVLPLDLEAAEPVVPLLPALLDQFLEESPEVSSLREWLFTAMPGNPFWAYALFAAAGSAGAGWLSTRPKEKRKPDPFTHDEDDTLTDGFPS
jgi:hypothetical protein